MSSIDDLSNGSAVGRSHSVGGPPGKKASTGFGSPGSDATVRRIDLNDILIKHQEATFFVRVEGNALLASGIADNDVVIVDRSITPYSGCIVMAVVEGEHILRRFLKDDKGSRLEADDPAIAPYTPSEDEPIVVWGVVTFTIKSMLP